ncbi:hypothetical protein BG000_004576 [Podila horticola]|nr:hypothetical protein BG000_004576 [Podila horticola]
MQFKNLALIACVASVAIAQGPLGNLLCQVSSILGYVTCTIGAKDCVCFNTGTKPVLRKCLKTLLSDPAFTDTLSAADISA